MIPKTHDAPVLGSAAREFLARSHQQLFINGRWVDAVSDATFPVFDPATGSEIAQVAEADAADIDIAVGAARSAYEGGAWSKMKPTERERLLWRLADLIESHAEELAQLEALDNGKSVMTARYGDVAMAVDFCRYMAGWATKISGATIPVSVPSMPDARFFAYTVREPIGVIGQIIPWHFPLLMAVWKLAPVLAVGCTAVLKPAEETPLSALRLGELIQEAGYPPGVVNIVTGSVQKAGMRIAAHPGVDKVAFAGSREVGRRIVQAASGDLKKITLELGGKSPAIIMDDADLELAIPGAAMAIYFNHGQVCNAGSRLYVAQSIFDRVVEGVATIARSFRLGPGLASETQMGPLVSAEQRNRVCAYIEAGLRDGARAQAGGGAVDRPGYFVAPTLLTDTHDEMEVVHGEIFGPVVVATPFTTSDTVIREASSASHGLGASVWTRDHTLIHGLTPKLKAGTIWVNCHNVLDSALPFGGYKQSGWGRESGGAALDLYTETKSVMAMV